MSVIDLYILSARKLSIHKSLPPTSTNVKLYNRMHLDLTSADAFSYRKYNHDRKAYLLRRLSLSNPYTFAAS